MLALALFLTMFHHYGDNSTINEGWYVSEPLCDAGYELRGPDGAGPWLHCFDERYPGEEIETSTDTHDVEL